MAEGSQAHVENGDIASCDEHRQLKLPIIKDRSSRRANAFKDITSHFTQAASALKTGQLVKDDFFTLFEAVGALEIMDPKMDSGYLAPGETLEDDYDVLQKLLPEEVVGIMDQLLCSEMAWHMDNPLSQTLFTSLYIDRLLWPEPKTINEASFNRNGLPADSNPLVHTVLRAYCLALIKTCGFVHNRISQETYYEEEDFVTNLYNRTLLSSFDVSEFEALLDRATEFVKASDNLPEHVRHALLHRLNFRRSFLLAASIDTNLVETKSNDYWIDCTIMLVKVFESSQWGAPVEGCFSTKIQRRLASTVPPRPIVSISFTAAHDFLKRLCEDGAHVGRVLGCRGGSNILTFVLIFQSRKPQPCVYMRCLLQSLIFSEMRVLGTMSIKELIFEDLAEIVLPADTLVDYTNVDIETPQDPRFQIARKMDDYVMRVGQSYLDIFRALSMNRSRMRRMLCHTVLEWENVQLDSEDLDIELRQYSNETPLIDQHSGGEEMWSYPLSSWAYLQKLRQMQLIIQLGFELQIYQVDELAGMYWYLQNIAYTQFQHLERIQAFTTRRLNQISRSNPSQAAAFSKSFSFLGFAMLEASATQSLADALFILYISLDHLSLLDSRSSLPYSTPSFRHSLRMRPFLQLSVPAVPTYEEFNAVLSPFFTSAHSFTAEEEDDDADRLRSFLDSAELVTKVARKEWEAVGKSSAETARYRGCEDGWKAGQKDVLRSVIATGIAVAGVKKWVAEGGKPGGKGLKVEVGRTGYHDWWVVPKITSTPG